MSEPRAYHVSGAHVTPCSESEESLLLDPRGVLWMWEEPKSYAKYIFGGDPTVGVTGWSRATRTDGDEKTDNGALEVFRVNALKLPKLNKEGKQEIDEFTKQPRYILQDLQVAEFAAPCDAVELARIAAVIGRIYAGVDEDQCELIYEGYPGPGVLMTQELLRLGYRNLWMWEYITDVAEQSNRIGWQSTNQSQRLLWQRSRRHLMERRAIIRSPWLLEEYSNAVIDLDKMRAKASYGFHDDRIQAANQCFWAGHKWTYDPDTEYAPVTEMPEVNYQRLAPVLGEYTSYRDAWAEAVDGWD